MVAGTWIVAKYEAQVVPWARVRATTSSYTRRPSGGVALGLVFWFFGSDLAPKLASTGKVYSFSQSKRPEDPNKPMLGNCGAWMWVSIWSILAGVQRGRRLTNESRKEKLIPLILGLHHLDLASRRTAGGSIAISPTMTREERFEASIVMNLPIKPLNPAICRRNPKSTLVPN